MPRVTEHPTDVCDRLDERALPHDDIRPNAAHQLILADDLTGARSQHEQHVQCLLAQARQLVVRGEQLASIEVKHKAGQLQPVCSLVPS